MTTNSYYYASPQPLDNNNNVWKTAAGAMISELLSQAFIAGTGVPGKIIAFCVDIATGDLVEQTLDFVVTSSNGTSGTIAIPSQDPISVSSGLEQAAAVVLGSALAVAMGGGVAVVAAANIAASILVSYFSDGPTGSALSDFVDGSPQLSITLKSGGNIIAGGVLKETVTADQELSIPINGLITASHTYGPGFPAITPGMTIEITTLGITDTLRSAYTVYDGAFVLAAATALERTFTSADSSTFFWDGTFGLARWRDTTDSESPLTLVENRFVDKYIIDPTPYALSQPLIFARAQDVLSIDMDGNAETPLIDFSPAHFISGSGIFNGDSFGNLISGSETADIVNGGSGTDFLIGKGGNDALDGGANDDYVYGGDGNDVLAGGAGKDIVNGGAGADHLVAAGSTVTGLAGDNYVGGDGVDLIDYSEVVTPSGLVGLKIDLSEGNSQLIGAPEGSIADTLNLIEDVKGSVLADLIIGDDGNNNLAGGGSNDLLIGGYGADALAGGSGDDIMIGSKGTSQSIWGSEVGAGADVGYSNDAYIIAMPLGVGTATAAVSLADASISVSNTLWGEIGTSLHQVEAIIAEVYDPTNAITTSSSGSVGIKIAQLDVTFMQIQVDAVYEGLGTSGKPTIVKGMQVTLGTQKVGDFYNFGYYNGTTNKDHAELNSVQGLTFNGISGRDGVSYAGATYFPGSEYGHGYGFAYEAGTVLVGDGSGAADTLMSIKSIEVTSAPDTISLNDLSDTSVSNPLELKLVAPSSGFALNVDYIEVKIEEGKGGYFEVDSSSGGTASAVFVYQDIPIQYDMKMSLTTYADDGELFAKLTVHGIAAGDAVTVAWSHTDALAGVGLAGVGFSATPWVFLDASMGTVDLVDYMTDHPTDDGTDSGAPSQYQGEWTAPYLATAMNYWFVTLGNAYYHVNEGDGTTVIDDANGDTDSVKFGVNVSASSVGYAKTGTDLTISYGTSGDTVVVEDFFNAATTSHRIEKVQFANGTVHGLPFILEQVFTQNGTAAADVLTGVDYVFDPKDYLYGLGGNDTLNGGAGADKMVGGLGDDTYIVDNSGDTITENASEGADTVSSSTSYTLSANVENLTLTGSSNLDGTGNSDTNVITGNSGDNTLDGGAGVDTLMGGDGNDTYIVDAGDVVSENASAGTDTLKASFTVDLASYANFENVVLTGSSNLNAIGDSGANAFTGNSGNNTLDGGAGRDTLVGGLGDDTYIVDQVSEHITENAGEGTDTLISSAISSFVNTNVENLILIGPNAVDGIGNALGNAITGTSGVNTLDGGNGNDTLDGGAGADVMTGGMGDDTFVIDNVNDVYVEWAGEGTDTLLSSISFTMANSAVEQVILTGSTDINATGNAGANSITGNSGNNTLDGGGGADTLSGGAGDDTYVIDSGDIVSENVGEGNDTVQAGSSFSLSSYANVENGSLTTAAGTAYIIGNSSDNTLTGNSSVNTLIGGTGADVLIGGLGNDLYYVDDAADMVVEASGEGTGDYVFASVSYSISASPNVERLELTGSSNLNGTGSGGDNWIWGNSGNNTLDGGSGTDTLIGRAGDDAYIVDSQFDVIVEEASEGVDTVQSSAANYGLSSNIEKLVLTGSGDINGGGNFVVNTLIGNSGNNTLDGGQDADVLIGGAGNDVYGIDNAGDWITENASEGTDLVQSSVNFSIASFANVENLTLTGTATSATGNNGSNILIGNSSVNVLTGNDGNDTLDGAAGADTLDGGAGDDKYIVDNVSDFILNANETSGTDTVESNVTFSLTALSNIENLTLTGSTAVTATGSSGNNILSGELNSAVNSLVGGAGDDSYYIGTGDVVVEAASAGTDTVYSGLSTYTLTTNAENLVLTGTDNISGTGNGVANTLTGNSGNNILSGGTGADTLIGGAGDDTYIVDNAGDVVSENSAEGTDTVSSAVTFSLAGFAHVENLTLTGTTVNATGNALDNTLTGSSSVNILTGAGGNDYLDGAAGADTMIGGTGDDTFVVSVATDVLSENAGEGTDLVRSAVTCTLAANFENLTLTAATAINGTGNSDVNTLTGGTGANSLNGMAGADTMIGGAGNDIYFVDDVGDVVIELSAEGTDSVQSGVGYTLTSNVENLTLTGSGNNNATGNSAVNTLTGNTGNNTLDGGAGADDLNGGTGNDTYLVDDAGDTVTEAASAGTDLVLSSASFTLGTNLENLILTGSGNINGTGNTVVNTLTGNSGNNTLTGGTGADTLIGGAGDDTYFVDNAGDVVSENASEGTDTVSSTVTFSLASLSDIEHLTLTGTTVINATGNGLDNILTGNAVKNILTGGGGNDTIIAGGGADTMLGGTGDDLYIVSVTSSVISESASEGTDSVQSSVTYTLSAEVENLTLTAATAINGTGNGSANILMGGTGNNALSAGAGNDTLDGGTGLDTLTGGADADIFVFGNVSNIDVVTDFSTAQGDAIDIRDLLSGYNPGSHTITDWVRITDVSANSKVEIDRDGTGGTYGWVQIATLNGVTGLTDEAALVANGNLLAA